MPDERDEIARIERVYRGYAADPRTRHRWSPTNAGNLCIERERDDAVREALDCSGLWPPLRYRILDVGCGAGTMLRRVIGWGARVQDTVGVDLLADRLAAAAIMPERPQLVRGDGAQLPFRSGSFRLVIVFTVFSSILDDRLSELVAAEVDRVLEPGGGVLWYDFRVSNPRNRNTRGIDRRRIRNLFPGYDLRLRSVTLVPQVARKLGPLTRSAYPALAALPFTRTHYAGVLGKS